VQASDSAGIALIKYLSFFQIKSFFTYVILLVALFVSINTLLRPMPEIPRQGRTIIIYVNISGKHLFMATPTHANLPQCPFQTLRPYLRNYCLWTTTTRNVYVCDIPTNFGCNLSPGAYVLKARTTTWEIDLMLAAGSDCAVTPLVVVTGTNPLWGPQNLDGFLMNYETPILEYLKSCDGTTKDLLAKQFLEILTRLHQKGIIHGDAKLLNVVASRSSHRPLLVDFEFSQYMRDVRFNQFQNIPVMYTSPARIRSPLSQWNPIKKEDDLWAGGITAWEIATGERAFGDMDEDDIEEALRKGQVKLDMTKVDSSLRGTILDWLKRGNK